MFSIRPATIQDTQAIQQANLSNLPENYNLKYIIYHGISWPQGSYVATIPTNDGTREKVVGYVLAKMEDDDPDRSKDDPPAAHITSISVMRTYRRMGIAAALLKQCLRSMRESYHAEQVSLHVRKSNNAALNLYTKALKFEVIEVTSAYYANNEDAYSMRRVLDDSLLQNIVSEQDVVDQLAEDMSGI